MTTRGARDTSPPTDLELMLYADGELPEERLPAVQAWLEGEPAGDDARDKLAALGLVSDLIRAHAHEASAGAGDIASAVMRRIEAEAVAPSVPVPAPRPPANDNARGFYVIAAAVVAAAAALLLWVRPSAAPHRNEVAQLTAPMPPVEPAAPSIPELAPEHGVEVAAVDFGSRMGAVFYVPTGTSASSTTTVVWLSDDPAGENQ